MRAFRLDKMSLAALEATLVLHRDAPQRIPVLRMIGQGEDALRARAERLLQLVGDGRVESSEGFAGGGSLPEERMRSFGLSLPTPKGADETAALLRSGSPAVVCRFKDGRLLADILAVSDEELPELAYQLRAMLAWKHGVVGVIGHVDHGKTALVRALTGQETDRLPQEKERGIVHRPRFRALARWRRRRDRLDRTCRGTNASCAP